MRLIKIIHYLLMFHITVPFLLCSIFFISALGWTMGRKFSTDMRLLINLFEVSDLLSAKMHKQFWREIFTFRK